MSLSFVLARIHGAACALRASCRLFLKPWRAPGTASCTMHYQDLVFKACQSRTGEASYRREVLQAAMLLPRPNKSKKRRTPEVLSFVTACCPVSHSLLPCRQSAAVGRHRPGAARGCSQAAHHRAGRWLRGRSTRARRSSSCCAEACLQGAAAALLRLLMLACVVMALLAWRVRCRSAGAASTGGHCLAQAAAQHQEDPSALFECVLHMQPAVQALRRALNRRG